MSEESYAAGYATVLAATRSGADPEPAAVPPAVGRRRRR